MSWAGRRRFIYLATVILFFVIVIGTPVVYLIISIKPTCFDGKQNQGETAPDKSGPCLVLDERYITPYAVMWARSFEVRDGSYTAVSYISNPNPDAGVRAAQYRFGLYDSQNILVAERVGTTFIMPGGITPVLEASIDTGNREVVHTYLQIIGEALVWESMASPAAKVKISNQRVGDSDVGPRIDARAHNTALDQVRNVSFVAVVFDPAGNAFAASGTALPLIGADTQANIAFTWPTSFVAPIGRIDIIPVLPPTLSEPTAE